MKKAILKVVMTVLVAHFSLHVHADDAQIDGIWYNLDRNSKTAMVTSPGANAYSGAVSIPATVTYNEQTYDVTSIDDYAFSHCKGLTSVTIPNSVTFIGFNAFANCTNMTSVTIGNGVTSIYRGTFYGCIVLTSVTIPNSVTSIGPNAFEHCIGLTSVTIPNSVTSIDNTAFFDCRGLTSIKVESGNPKFDSRDNCNAIIETETNTLICGCSKTIIPNSVTSIGSGAFSSCSGLTSITIPNSVTSIGSGAFYGCSGLTSVTIPNSVTSIGSSAFWGCSGLTSIEIPNSVTSIEQSVFRDCSCLISVTIPNSVTSMGSDAFEGCSSLTSVTIPNSVTSIEHSVFRDCSGLTSIKVESGNTKYDSRDNCNAIIETTSNNLIVGCKNTIIPNSVISIGYGAFEGSSSLTSMTIPNSVTSIGGAAFRDCSGLTSITIGNSVASIENDAFYPTKLKNVYVKGFTPSDIDQRSFSQAILNHAVLYVPVGAWDTYAYDDNWCNFINIREMSTATESLSAQNVYTLVNTSDFGYMVYDPVNDEVRTGVPVNGLDENNPNNCWQTVEVSGQTYLYNLGAKKFAVPTEKGEALTLTDKVSAITLENSGEGLILAGERNAHWGFVENENMAGTKNLDDMVTAIGGVPYHENTKIAVSGASRYNYNINGQQIPTYNSGLNIIRTSDGKTKKVMVK